MLQTFDFAGARQINQAGTFFRYELGNAAGADTSLRIRADGNDCGLVWPGDAFRLPSNCQTWDITPTTPTCTGTVRIGVGSVESARLVGTVSIVNGNRSDVLASKAFTITSDYGGTAGTYAGMGIWVPPGSTVNAVVEEVGISAAAASTVRLGLINMAPANLDNTTNNKLLGGASATPVQRAYEMFSVSNPASFTRIYTWISQTSASKVFLRPIVVPPGFGLVAINQTVAQILSVNMEWTNEPR